MSTMIVDRFSAGLDDLSRKEQKDHIAVLRVMSKMTRYSVFEATENESIARTLDYIIKARLIKHTGGSYPWANFELTDAGRELLGMPPVCTPKNMKGMI